MTPPIHMGSVPPNVLESIAFNLCSLHDFDPAFVQQNERFALATITEYLRAQPTAAPVREEGGAVLANDLRCLKETFERIAARPPEDQPHYKSGVRPFGTGDLRHIIEVLTKAAALATREEAPAEAGADYTEGAKLPDGAISGTDDGQTVWLESSTGGAHRLGMWGGLSLRFEQADGSFTVRDYEDVNLRAQPQAREGGVK